jgi:hypothetical protein
LGSCGAEKARTGSGKGKSLSPKLGRAPRGP